MKYLGVFYYDVTVTTQLRTGVSIRAHRLPKFRSPVLQATLSPRRISNDNKPPLIGVVVLQCAPQCDGSGAVAAAAPAAVAGPRRHAAPRAPPAAAAGAPERGAGAAAAGATGRGQPPAGRAERVAAAATAVPAVPAARASAADPAGLARRHVAAELTANQRPAERRRQRRHQRGHAAAATGEWVWVQGHSSKNLTECE